MAMKPWMSSVTWRTVLSSLVSCLMVGRLSKTASGSLGDVVVVAVAAFVLAFVVASTVPLLVGLDVGADEVGLDTGSGAKTSSVNGHFSSSDGS